MAKQFTGFSEDQMKRIAQKLGYSGPMNKFNEFLASNPGSQRAFSGLEAKAKMKFNQGGAVRKYQTGGFEVGAAVIPKYVNPQTGQQYLRKDAAPDPSVLVPYTAPTGVPKKADYETPPQGLSRTNPFPNAIQNAMAPGRGNTFAYDAQGQRYIVPESYQFAGDAQKTVNPTNGGTFGSAGPKPIQYTSTAPSITDLQIPFAPMGNEQYQTRRAPLPGQQYQGPPLSYDGLPGMPQPVYGNQPLQQVEGNFLGQPSVVLDGNQTLQTAATQTQRPVVGTDSEGNPIYQTGEGVGAPVIGAATPLQQPYGPVLDAEGNPQQVQVLDVEGNPVLDAEGNPMYQTQFPTIGDISVNRMFQPGLPSGGVQLAQAIDPTTQQQIATGTGQVGTAPQAATPDTATTAQATAPVTPTANTYNASQAGDIGTTTAAAGMVGPNAEVQAATQDPKTTEVANIGPAQLGQAQQIQPAIRELSPEEIIQAPADAQAAAQFAEQVQAAQAQPTEEATVQGQLANLMADFEDGATPAWAAGAMRNATAIMAQRGLGASSMAGQAIVQAAMEASLPIAVQDAQTVAQFEQMNLSNRQARAMLAAQQRAQFIGQEFDQQFQARVANAAKISDIANMNFNAEQQVALENAQLAQTVDLANLSNRQAKVMAQIAQTSQLETTNLNNRQQEAVQNAQSFLQMDMANLSNEQQAKMFDAQSRVQKILSDQAAENAARQFNASSQNQIDQYFANLATQVSQFNATQSNAMEQFNTEQKSAIERFNTEVKNQRDQFNAQNELVIAQSNAQWRRDIATANTAAINVANQNNAQAVLDISEQAYSNLWQAFEDQMAYAWESAENKEDRINAIVRTKLQADSTLKAEDIRADAAASTSLGRFATYALFGSGGLLGG